ncbi:MAG: hypothetical protein QF785_07665 [Phycisphaeraceae bacterium]|nr:hypothetical protein [Phycisphaeraceae bacterium]
MPARRDLYVLMAGVVIGVVAGPVHVRVAPGSYDRLLRGGGVERSELKRIDGELDAWRKRIEATGATDSALDPREFHDMQRRDELAKALSTAERGQRRQLDALSLAILLVLVLVMMLETLLRPEQQHARERFTAIRYALVAAWIALTLARPSMLRDLNVAFLTLLVVVTALAAWVPLKLKSGGRGESS